jgi:hypothetical protein
MLLLDLLLVTLAAEPRDGDEPNGNMKVTTWVTVIYVLLSRGLTEVRQCETQIRTHDMASDMWMYFTCKYRLE